MMIEYILWGIFIFLLIFYSAFLISILNGLNKLRSSKSNQIPKEFVSVLIPFRNESENIIANVKSIINQNYPDDRYEVIYINDNSTDDTLQLLIEFSKPDRIKVLSLPDNNSPNAHKKRSIAYGIEKSKGDLIVTTDADCFYSENWLRSLLSNFDAETGFISGPVEFIEEENLFSRIQKLEFAGLILTGAGLIGAGRPIICNGANIAYRKKVFDEVGGFNDQINLSSGDDELLMQKIAKETKYKIEFSLNRDSIVKTKSNSGINNFYQQRKRWASKGLFYKNTNLIVMLLLIFLFYFGLIILPFIILFLSTSFVFILFLSVIIKLLLEYLIIRKGKKMLFPKLSLKEFILTEILQVPYIIVAGFAGMFGNLKWKGREIKR
ncbi:MAG: glycosyltransferase [Bacteroidetes bacterium]|nr:glycosyltransferase [Bacteroidota bacterium]MCH7771483.1 glycosyltransferase [Bacteroidota bacterium]